MPAPDLSFVTVNYTPVQTKNVHALGMQAGSDLRNMSYHVATAYNGHGQTIAPAPAPVQSHISPLTQQCMVTLAPTNNNHSIATAVASKSSISNYMQNLFSTLDSVILGNICNNSNPV